MKSVFVLVCTSLLLCLQAPALVAGELSESRSKAGQYYQDRDFDGAYKIYFKLAKAGDYYSQDKISHMHATGEGVAVDLTEAYAWSVLAAESGVDRMLAKSDELLQQVDDQAKAHKRAAKIKRKYGKEALLAKAERKAKHKRNHRMGGCTGSKLGCS